MKTKLIALTAVMVTVAATVATAATRIDNPRREAPASGCRVSSLVGRPRAQGNFVNTIRTSVLKHPIQ